MCHVATLYATLNAALTPVVRVSDMQQQHNTGKACADDINKYCKVTWYDGMSTGNVMSCLRDVKAALKPGCKKEVFKLQLDGANDYRSVLECGWCLRRQHASALGS